MMPKILCIETSEDYCGVALAEGKSLVLQLFDDAVRNHSQVLTVLINNLLDKINLNISLIDVVAISKGPGSYTGLRIGTSVAKGLCYALGKPLVAINTLEIMCYAAYSDPVLQKHLLDLPFLCPMIDARRMEVYMQFFDAELRPVSDIEAKIVASETFSGILRERKIVFFGSGADKVERFYDAQQAVFLRNIRPMAMFMVEPALKAFTEKKFEDVAYFEPYYLKNFVPTRPTKNLLGDR